MAKKTGKSASKWKENRIKLTIVSWLPAVPLQSTNKKYIFNTTKELLFIMFIFTWFDNGDIDILIRFNVFNNVLLLLKYITWQFPCSCFRRLTFEMSLMTTAGKRGRVSGCAVCSYHGERHTVMKYVFAKHLAIEEWPYQCTLCQYNHYNYRNFSSHIRWYESHKSMAMTVTTFSLQGQEEMRPESKIAFTMMKQWSIEESGKYWESKRRPSVPPLPQLPSSLLSHQSFPKITPRVITSCVHSFICSYCFIIFLSYSCACCLISFQERYSISKLRGIHSWRVPILGEQQWV